MTEYSNEDRKAEDRTAPFGSLTVLGETSMIQEEQELLAIIHTHGLSSILLKGKFGQEECA